MQQFDRHSLVGLEDGLEAIRSCTSPKRVPINGIPIKLSSLRLRTFAEAGTKCVSCGLEATHFAIERDSRDTRSRLYHLNLWSMRDGEEVLFTHDHIKARSLGGLNCRSNTQTMCGPCNWEKGVEEREELERIRSTQEVEPNVG